MAFENPIVAGEELVISGIRSDNYKEATDGWRVGRDGTAQFSTLNLLGDFGALGDVSADSFHVGDGGLWLPDNPDLDVASRLQSLETNIFFPPIITFFGDRASGTFTAAAEVPIGEVQWNDPIGGMLMVIAQAGFASSVADDAVCLRLRYTSDGSAPTITSTLLQGGPPVGCSIANRLYGGFICYSELFSANTAHRLLLTVARSAGSGNVTPAFTNNTRTQITAFRINPTDVNSSMINAGGGGAPPATPVTKTTVYQPTWSRTYDGDNSTTWDDSAHCYQGYFSGDRGNTKSLVGYNYTQIQSDLAGATINSIKLTFKVAHAYLNAGMTVEIGAHNYTSKPSTWAGGNVFENQTTKTSAKAGSSYTVTLPAGFGTNFKSGTYKGISFGPGPSTSNVYYGYLYGQSESGKPTLSITYTK